MMLEFVISILLDFTIIYKEWKNWNRFEGIIGTDEKLAKAINNGKNDDKGMSIDLWLSQKSA